MAETYSAIISVVPVVSGSFEIPLFIRALLRAYHCFSINRPDKYTLLSFGRLEGKN